MDNSNFSLTISSFSGRYAFLSNFAWSPFVLEGLLWNTVEHYFQAQKTVNPKDRREIRLAGTPGKAKRLGRKVRLRSDWERVKVAVMTTALEAKFTQHSDMLQKLLETQGSVLIEGNHWHDNFWGDCSCVSCVNIKGSNNLGKLLMRMRNSKLENLT